MTEIVLIFPLFVFFLMAFAKLFALLILVQKMEIASFYAARRWQLESHRNVAFEADDGANSCSGNTLCGDIKTQVMEYIGYGTPKAGFLDLASGSCPVNKDCTAGAPGVSIQRTQVWNVVTVTACTNPVKMPFLKTNGFTFCSTKYVPNRDRPIAFVLPGLNNPP
ncbi:MAG: hypothetical protein ACHQ51_11255 [Elusimicrobiota bacterium]